MGCLAINESMSSIPQEDLKSRIISAARHRFLERGVAGTSLRQVSRDVGVSVSSIGYYFPEKGELLSAALQPALEKLLLSVEAICRLPGTVEERLFVLNQRFETAAPDEIEVLKLLLRLVLGEPKWAYLALQPISHRISPSLKALVGQECSNQKVASGLHPGFAMICAVSLVGIQRWLSQLSQFFPAAKPDAVLPTEASVLPNNGVLLGKIWACLVRPAP